MMKTGRLSKEEQKIILDNNLIMTAEQLAEKLSRRVEPIQKFLDENAPQVKKVDSEDRELLNVLHGKVYWRSIGEQFSKKEIHDFEVYWTELVKQFNNDIEFSEEMQIVDLVKLRLLIDRNLFERNHARAELEELQRIHDDFKQEHGSPPYDNPSHQIQEATLASQVKMCESSYTGRTSEFTVLVQKQQQYFDELKATRKQRIEHLKQTKKDWVKLMKDMCEEKNREREGREVALMNLATEKERAKLAEIHIFSNGEGDKPLLSDETVKE